MQLAFWGRSRHRLPEEELGEHIMVDPAIPLNLLVPGQSATIVRVGGNGAVRRRFMEMGFIRGEQILVERVAPLGDPVEYLIKGCHLSLRKADATQILVEIDRDTSDE